VTVRLAMTVYDSAGKRTAAVELGVTATHLPDTHVANMARHAFNALTLALTDPFEDYQHAEVADEVETDAPG
jgi:hypothetical protein